MQATVDIQAFTGLLSRHIKFLAARVPEPVLGGVRLTVADGEIRLITFDYEVSVTSSMDVAGAVNGGALVGARLLADTLSKFDPKTPVVFTSDGVRLTVVQGRTKATLHTLPLDEYPSLPEVQWGTAFSMAPGTLTDIAGSCLLAAGRDDTLPVLRGLAFTLSGGTLTVAATDRYRFAVLERAVRDVCRDGGDSDRDALVPGSIVKTLAAVFKKTAGTVRVRFGTAPVFGSMAWFEADGTVVVTQLLEGALPKYKSLFPKEFTAEYDMQRPDATKAAQLAASVAERNTPIKLTMGEKAVTFEGGASDDAVISSEIDAEASKCAGGVEVPVTVAFNPTFFADGLKSLPSDQVRLSVTTPTKPAVLSSPDAPGYWYLIMPVRLSG